MAADVGVGSFVTFDGAPLDRTDGRACPLRAADGDLAGNEESLLGPAWFRFHPTFGGR